MTNDRDDASVAQMSTAWSVPLPVGVVLRDLRMHPDERGTFTEIFRSEWDTGITPIQWNCVSSVTGTLRGVHVHARHDDYLIVLRGLASVALRDLRQDSPTSGQAVVIDLDGERLRAISIPAGVAHGFYFRRDSLHLYSVSHYWDPADELGCRWDDPDLALAWRIPEPPRLSPRDASADSLRRMIADYERRRQELTDSEGEIRLP